MTTADQSPAAAKAALRGQIRAARRSRTDAERVHAAGALAARVLPLLAEAEVVACYLSMPAEPGTSALIDLLLQRNVRIALPRVHGQSLDWVDLTNSTTFATNALGISEPEGPHLPKALDECEAIILPALAVSRDGIRLGQGGGFYDRALASVPPQSDGGPTRLALIFDDELLDSVPHESHDSRVDHAVTPDRVLSFRARD